MKADITELLSRFEALEINYINKDEELRRELSWFMFDQTQLAKTFQRDVEDLKRLQQEHMSKLDRHLITSSLDDMIQQQVNKYYHYKHAEDDDEEDDDENHDEQRNFINKLDQLHDEHVSWLKKKKKNFKIVAPVVERFRMLYNRLFHNCSLFIRLFLEEICDHLSLLDNN